jgi:restriction endonuclease S subunit
LSIQQEIVAKIEQYEKIIAGAKQVVDNYKPQIDVNPDWEMVELGKIIKLSSGRGLTQQNMVEGEYPVYGGNGINGYHNEYFIEDPIIVIGRVGAYCGSVHTTTPKAWVTDNGLYVTEYLIPINQDYLAQMLTQLELNRYAKVGGQPSISQTTVYERQIPLPTIDEQAEIISKLKHEQSLIHNNKELIQLFEQKIKDEINKLWSE